MQKPRLSARRPPPDTVHCSIDTADDRCRPVQPEVRRNTRGQMSTTWNTKWGVRRVRVELPTLEEALDAASDLATGPEAQIALAAELMDVPLLEVKARAEQILRARIRRPQTLQPRIGRAPVVVERKVSRRLVVR